MRVSIVVPVFNSERTLGIQLEALLQQTYKGSLQVIVSDNGSTDETVLIAESIGRRFPSFLLVDASDSVGVGHARNVAFREVDGDMVLFCDGDDEVAPNWIDEMLRALSIADMVGGRLDLAKLNNDRSRHWRTDPSMTRLPRAMKFLPYAIGANLGVSVKTYRALGGCDESYIGGHDDVELCWRAQLAGFTLSYSDTAVVNYRLRSELRRLAIQRYHSGLTYAQLFSQYRQFGIQAGSLSKDILIWIRLVLSVWRLLLPKAAGQWMFSAAWHWGRARGNLKFRVVSPS